MKNYQKTYNQVNAIISLLPENERALLPNHLIEFFQTNSNCPPEESINTSLPLSSQEFEDEALLLLYYIHRLL